MFYAKKMHTLKIRKIGRQVYRLPRREYFYIPDDVYFMGFVNKGNAIFTNILFPRWLGFENNYGFAEMYEIQSDVQDWNDVLDKITPGSVVSESNALENFNVSTIY